ncbi:superoxide dismutase, Ni [Enterovibrio norvegicus]|uniref:Superoxide dismutase, Ni n=1 Tax=Enterovibrio norvegicus TaxID=188144 RepID=A0A2N7L6Q5_9GAMM|nr:superoxide dismutase, Ni [Enterovibrio norvegicus]PML76594.1 superoxide dismutase, Ni [Enterovibrio norvegicus]PMN65191.1 superoxide dismutase, Ni [Enterovibrio norvegicus]PMN89608.1 superoxide dismutase, Ni [Enterovibrio norvegicus]
MLYALLNKLDQRTAFTRASAHCDIPCKIYDPSHAQIAALTIIRMLDLIEELPTSALSQNQQARFVRLVQQKEEHGSKVKEDIRVIWGDYFKQPQFDTFPEIHTLTHDIMMLASKAKQEIDRDAALALLDKVNRFADIFWQSKAVPTYVATCPYPPALPVIYPDLKP